MVIIMYYVVTLPEKNGLEALSPYIYLQISGKKQGYVDFSPRKNLVRSFDSFASAVEDAEKIYSTLVNLNEGVDTKFSKGIYVLDSKNDTLSIDMTEAFSNEDDIIESEDYLKGDIQ